MNYVYVLNKDGDPLMPTKRFRKVRHLLQDKRAKIVSYDPFTIQLNYEIENVVQDLYIGIDPGRTNIGISVVTNSGTCVYACELETRNKEIPKLMQERKQFRQEHRRLGRRRVRQRRAYSSQPNLKGKEIQRCLPGYSEDKYIVCKGIKNKETKFNNRKRPEGWLTPTANQLLQSHINLVKKVQKILPLSNIVLEVNSFAFSKLDNPDIKPWQYARGKLFGFESRNDAIYEMQNGLCLLCSKNAIEHYHHIKLRSQGGSDTIDNIAGLCSSCHSKVHKEEKYCLKLQSKKQGLNKKYGALSVLNQIMPKLLIEFQNLLPLTLTDGKTTKAFRTTYNINKEHYLDAYCIACSALDESLSFYTPDITCFKLKQFRRHNRRYCHQHMLNRVYLDKENNKVAINRHKAIEQKVDSLEEYRNSHSHRLVSTLKVKEHNPVYLNMSRHYPGAKFYDNKENKFFILQGTVYGQYKDVNGIIHNRSKSQLYFENSGIVYLKAS